MRSSAQSTRPEQSPEVFEQVSIADQRELPFEDGDSGSLGSVRFPDVGPLSSTYALTARLAGRLNAASISPAELRNLLDERQLLIDRQLAGDITRKETIRLEYVRWSLDRIEDAKHGLALDRLEGYLERYETLLQELQGLQTRLGSFKR